MDDGTLTEPAEQIYRAAQALVDTMAGVGAQNLSTYINEILTLKSGSPGSALTPLLSLSSRLINADLNAGLLGSEEVDSGEVAPIYFPVGLRSPDGSALLGAKGFLFLVGGSNDVLQQYDRAENEIRQLASSWNEVFRRRSELAHRSGIAIYQIVIPEKITVISSLFPFPIKVPTSLLSIVDAEAQGGSLTESYVSVPSIFHAVPNAEALVKRADSHLTPFGSYTIFSELMIRIAGIKVDSFAFDTKSRRFGDLGLRMLGVFSIDEFYEVSRASLPAFCFGATKEFEVLPSPGRVTGFRQVWKNPKAPHKKTVVAFANSYFSTVENGQSSLSWWFSCWFSEFHFLWTNEVDFDYAHEVAADIIVWQGNERFLPVLSVN